MFVLLDLFHAIVNAVSVTNFKLFNAFNQLFELLINL